ncbi:RNA methyltransferase [bacterium]|nr:RNA methyltransferase [bacterium]
MDRPPVPDSYPPLSRNNEKLLGKLSQRKWREETGLFVAEGVRLVEEALACGVDIAWAVRGPEGSDTSARARGEALAAALAAKGVPVYRAEEAALRRVLDTVTPQGVAAVCRIPHRSLPEWTPPQQAVLAICDGLSQPGNLGSLVRAAAAAGAAAVVLAPGTVDPYNPKTVRGAMGALFRLPVFQARDEGELKEFLARHSFSLYEAAVGGEDIFAGAGYPDRTAVIFGSEAAGSGLSLALGGARRLSAPMQSGVESLNVAVAAGIVLYEICRRVGQPSVAGR